MYMSKSGLARIVLLPALLGAATLLRGADVDSGRQLYNRHCAGCHGPAGVSTMPNAPHVARSGTLMQPDLMLLASIRTGRNAMPGYAGILKDQEILDVIAYMRTFRP